MNRIFFLLLLLVISNRNYAQKNEDDLVPATKLMGKWIEVERLKGKASTSFTDTMQLEINNRTYGIVRYKMSKSFSGDAKQNGDRLIINDAEYKVIRHNTDELWLQNDRILHRLMFVKQFEDSPIAKSIGTTKEVKPKNLEINQLAGTWFCYKKEDSNFSNAEYYIRDMKITLKDKSSAQVKMKMANMGEAILMDGSMKLDKNVLEITTLTSKTDYIVSSFDESELVLKDGSKLYYFKKSISSK